MLKQPASVTGRLRLRLRPRLRKKSSLNLNLDLNLHRNCGIPDKGWALLLPHTLRRLAERVVRTAGRSGFRSRPFPCRQCRWARAAPVGHIQSHRRRRIWIRFSVFPVLPRKDVGLPGCWVVLLLRAVVTHPAGYGPILAALSGESHRRLRGFQPARHPESDSFRGWTATAHTFAYLRIADRVTAAVARLATDPLARL